MFVTGCDSGFGHAAAKHLHKLGFTVFAGCLLKVEIKYTEAIHLVLFQRDADSTHSPVFALTSHLKL